MSRATLWDRLVGPDATRAEAAGAVVAGMVGAGLAGWRAFATGESWWVTLLIGILAADLVGGVWANSTASTRRWYHRPGTWPGSHLLFASLHVHPFVMAWLVPSFGWTGAAVLYGGTLLATTVVATQTRRLQSPVAAVAALVVFTAATFTIDPTRIEWFVPAYVLKLIIGHAVPADPA